MIERRVRWCEFIFFTLLTTGMVSGLFSYQKYSLIPIGYVFEFVILISPLIYCYKYSHANIFILFSIFWLVAFKFFLSIYFFYVPISDFIIGNKFIIYLFVLVMMIGCQKFDIKYYERFYNILLIAFLFKYIAWSLLVNNRPGLFAENNFELMFLLLYSLGLYSTKGSLSGGQFFLFGLIFILSMSRSAIATLIAIMFILSFRGISVKSFLYLFFATAVSAVSAFFVLARFSGGLESIDRFVFFQQFIFSIGSWNWYNFIFGTIIQEPLPTFVCNNLSFYETLFSDYDSNICYSVIFHSFVLRLVYDFGLLGLLIVMLLLFYVIRSMHSPKVALCGCVIILLNGFSVSSLNSVYGFLGLFLLIVAPGNPKEIVVNCRRFKCIV